MVLHRILTIYFVISYIPRQNANALNRFMDGSFSFDTSYNLMSCNTRTAIYKRHMNCLHNAVPWNAIAVGEVFKEEAQWWRIEVLRRLLAVGGWKLTNKKERFFSYGNVSLVYGDHVGAMHNGGCSKSKDIWKVWFRIPESQKWVSSDIVILNMIEMQNMEHCHQFEKKKHERHVNCLIIHMR